MTDDAGDVDPCPACGGPNTPGGPEVCPSCEDYHDPLAGPSIYALPDPERAPPGDGVGRAPPHGNTTR